MEPRFKTVRELIEAILDSADRIEHNVNDPEIANEAMWIKVLAIQLKSKLREISGLLIDARAWVNTLNANCDVMCIAGVADELRKIIDDIEKLLG